MTEKDDLFYMTTALELAKKGEGFVSPNPMVGAVVVKSGEIVGQGFHEAAGKAHAEVNAIDDARERAKDATLYVTLEPCNHTGRTPPCTEKILGAGIKRVVMAMADPNPNVKGGGADFLTEHGVEVTSGVCEAEAKKLNEFFIKHIRTGMPFVILKCAATLDGRIATRTGDSKWVTGEKSRQYVHKLRHATDAIMVGIGTVKADNPRLTTRLGGIECVNPIRVILDSRLSISEKAKVLRPGSDAETIIMTSASAPPEKKAVLEKIGARVIEVPEKMGGLDLRAVLEALGKRGVTSILVEGGSRVVASVLAAGLVDKINFFYAPKILGGDDGVPICKGPGPSLMMDCIQIRDTTLHQFGDDFMVEGYL